MKLGVRGKLFFISVGLIAAVTLISGVYLEFNLRTWLVSRVEDELQRHAESVRVAVEGSSRSLDIAEMDALADDLGGAASARITIIAADGRVLGDSEVATEAIATIESHSDRPEVLEAYAEGLGSSQRFSATIETNMLYMAVPFARPDGAGVVRAANTLEQVDDAVGRLRVLLLVAGGMGLLVAIIMSGLASHLSSRSLRQLVESARDMTTRRARDRVEVSSSDEVGRLAGSLNILSEELESSVNALAAERDRLETVLEAMEEAVVALDAEQRITLVNGAAEALLGSSDSVVGRPLIEAIRSPALADLVALARDGDTAMAEFDLHGPEPKRLLAQVTPEQASEGVVLVMTDVTQMRRLETIRRDFVANISHELRTPVSVIQANIETLLDGALEDDPDRAQRFLEAIARNAQRLSRLISGLLDIAKLEADKYPLQLESLAVDDAIRRAIDSAEASALDKGLELEEPEVFGLWVVADRHALDQVVLNLLENAVKYTPRGGHVRVRASAIGDAVRIEVEDDGYGIEPRHQARIFERFYRVDSGRSRDSGGTGLGLAIVKHLVSAMQGRAGVEPAEPRGSIFWFELPRADGSDERSGRDEGRSARPQA